MPIKFEIEQRWSSEAEPELGLGIIEQCDHRNVKIHFPAADETRLYRIQNAPLKRAAFKQGDSITDKQGLTYQIKNVEIKNGLCFYQTETSVLREVDLADKFSFNNLEDRLIEGDLGHVKDFSLRCEAVKIKCELQNQKEWGLFGGRIELLEHQIFIAQNCAQKDKIRILLADEVGLGKTIEAGLIYHILKVRGLIQKTIVLAPKALIYQWMVEIYRRFNDMFTVIDDEVMENCKTAQDFNQFFKSGNNFILPTETLFENANLTGVLLNNQWDLMIMDEAHHIKWENNEKNPEYELIHALAQKSNHVMLLTATPLQMGEESHYGRLKMLDPSRFSDFDLYLNELKDYQNIIPIINELIQNNISDEIQKSLLSHYPKDKKLHQLVQEAKKTPEKIAVLIDSLIDRHGTGRMVFRNRREVLTGFPKRIIKPNYLKWDPDLLELIHTYQKNLHPELQGLSFDTLQWTPGSFVRENGIEPMNLKKIWMSDPRLLWLKTFMKKLPKSEKVLLICQTRAKVLIIQELIPSLFTTNFTVFHEDLPLSTRDKNAAYFSKTDGAQLLISSEIGSEGRNFQFAKHLILFDMPESAGILEQRIGRLHRIGQKNNIEIYPLLIKNTPGEMLYHWYHHGIDALNNPHLGSDIIYDIHHDEIENLAKQIVQYPDQQDKFEDSLDTIIDKTVETMKSTTEKIEQGRNRLLELHSFQAEIAHSTISNIKKRDSENNLEKLLEKVFEAFGIDFTPTNEKRGYQIFPGAEMIIDSFPGLPETGLFITFDRELSLIREDLSYMTWEHPIVEGAMDLLLGSSKNNVAMGEWKDAPEQGLFIKLMYVYETTLHRDIRGLPSLKPHQIEILLDKNVKERIDLLPILNCSYLKQGSHSLLTDAGLGKTELDHFVKKGESIASDKVTSILKPYLNEIEMYYTQELSRLENLTSDKNLIDVQAEVKVLIDCKNTLLNNAQNASLRLDGLAFIYTA